MAIILIIMDLGLDLGLGFGLSVDLGVGIGLKKGGVNMKRGKKNKYQHWFKSCSGALDTNGSRSGHRSWTWSKVGDEAWGWGWFNGKDEVWGWSWSVVGSAFWN